MAMDMELIILWLDIYRDMIQMLKNSKFCIDKSSMILLAEALVTQEVAHTSGLHGLSLIKCFVKHKE